MSASAYRRAREIALKKVEEDRLASVATETKNKLEVPTVDITLETPVEEVTIQCTISNDDQVEVKSELDKGKRKRNKSSK